MIIVAQYEIGDAPETLVDAAVKLVGRAVATGLWPDVAVGGREAVEQFVAPRHVHDNAQHHLCFIGNAEGVGGAHIVQFFVRPVRVQQLDPLKARDAEVPHFQGGQVEGVQQILFGHDFKGLDQSVGDALAVAGAVVHQPDGLAFGLGLFQDVNFC